MKLMRSIPLSTLCLAPLYVLPYCQGQDLPFFEVPMFASNITHRSNFCFSYEAAYAGDVERRDALRGKNISIAVFDYLIDSDTGGVKENALFARFLDEIARRAGFEWRKTYGVIESPSDSNDYTYDEILYWATTVYDIMSEYYIRNINRLEMGIDFMEPWYDGSLVMVMQNTEEKDLQVATIFQPFSDMVWLLIILTVVASGFLYFIIDYLDSRRKSDVMEASLGSNIFLSAYAFTGHAIYAPRTISTRAVAWSLCFMFMVLTSIYTANMATLLMLSKKGKAADVNVIEDAIQADLTFCVWKSSATDTYLTKNYKSAKKLALQTEDECAEALLKDECQVYLAFQSSWKSLERDVRFNKDCKLEWVGRPAEEYDGSFTSLDNKDLCSNFLNDIITLHLVDMKIDGMFDQIWGAHYEATATIECETEYGDEPTTIDEASVDINQIGTLFILHFIITAFALIVSIIRCCRLPKDKKDRIKKEIKRYSSTPAKLKTSAEFAARHSKKLVPSHRFLRNIHFGKSSKMENHVSFGSMDACFENADYDVAKEDQSKSGVRLRKQNENLGEETCEIEERKTTCFKSDVDMIPNEVCETPYNDNEIDSMYDDNSQMNDLSDKAYRAYVLQSMQKIQSIYKIMQDLEANKQK